MFYFLIYQPLYIYNVPNTILSPLQILLKFSKQPYDRDIVNLILKIGKPIHRGFKQYQLAQFDY